MSHLADKCEGGLGGLRDFEPFEYLLILVTTMNPANRDEQTYINTLYTKKEIPLHTTKLPKSQCVFKELVIELPIAPVAANLHRLSLTVCGCSFCQPGKLECVSAPEAMPALGFSQVCCSARDGVQGVFLCFFFGRLEVVGMLFNGWSVHSAVMEMCMVRRTADVRVQFVPVLSLA